MGQGITQKILGSHLLHGVMSAGHEITIKVDQTLWSDLTGIMAAQILESVKPERISANPSVFYCDHNTLVTSSENADDHLYLKSVAQKFGVYFSKPGNGICHFLHCQRFAAPGKVLLGADSHTPTSGALGMVAIGSGGLSVAKCMLGEGFRLTMPKILSVRLSGRLAPGVSAKDVSLELLRMLSVKGGIGYILEFTGGGVRSLSIPERATIANMSIELGATTGLFPSDTRTRAFLRAQGREKDWIELVPDPGAEYEGTVEINLSRLEPLVAKPHMPDLVVRAREAGKVKVNSVFIGSCTNASYSDIAKAARILRGRKVHRDIDLTVAPGSRQVLEHLVRDGILADLIASGARVLECACGPCIGIGQAPAVGGVAVRTSNRNFKGRGGTNEAFIYLASPETAAATAVAGEIADPRDVFDVKELKGCGEPAAYRIDDSMIIAPHEVEDPGRVAVARGENIAPLPERGAMHKTIEAAVVIKLGDNITTDDIIPANANILKHIANIPKFAEYTFCYTDETFVTRIKQMKHSVIVGGENYGQGSSREHAALLPMFFGVQAVVAKSFARIHRENLINYGILPLLFKHKDDHDRIEESDLLVIEDLHSQVDEEEVTVRIANKNIELKTLLKLSDFDRAVLKAGGALNYLREKARGHK